jgi:hypothetical protein
MAQRYGGSFSPKPVSENDAPKPASGAYKGARVDPAGARSNVLFVPAIPMVATSFDDGALGLSLAVGAGAVWILGAWLMREGLRAEATFAARRVARRPALPRKMVGSVILGIGTAIAAFKTDPGLIAPVLLGVVTSGLSLAAFGLDPLRDKGMEGVDTFQQDRVARVVDEAEAYLGEMSDAIRRAGDRAAEARLAAFQGTVRDLITTVEEDPRDLTAARRFLGVYLLGARDATVKFADIHARTQDAQARADYLSLLDDLEKNYAARTRAMMLEDRSDLTVEIDVLRERLQREGLRL